MRGKALLCIAALLAGCERAPLPLDISDERLMVHSVLLAGSETVHVLVERVAARTITDPHSPEGSVDIQPISGADVEVTVGGQVLQLAEAPEGFPPCASAFPFAVPHEEPIGPGCYVAAVPDGIRAGERYELRVRVGGVVVAEGEAVVPGLPVLSTPTAGARYEVTIGFISNEQPVRGILIRYGTSSEVAGVRPSLRFDSVFVNGARTPDATCNFDQFESEPIGRRAAIDSTVLVPRSLFCFRRPPQGGVETFVPDSIFAQLSLTAFDSSYVGYDQAARQQSAELARLQAGVTGALGLFAGLSRARVPVVLLPIEGTPGF